MIGQLPRCLKPWTNFEIDDGQDSWGAVRPCCWSLKKVGDLSSNNLMEIWNGPGFLEFRRRILSGDLDGLCPETCPNLQPSANETQIYLSGLVTSHRHNDFLNLKEVMQRRVELASLPVYMKVSPTLACNLRCVMCYQSHEATTKLSDEMLDQIIKWLPTMRLVRLQGGEIFASQSGLAFLQKIAETPVQPRLGLITNATFPIRGGLDLLDRLNLKWMICSLDASSPEKYAKIRIGGNWEAVTGNLDVLTGKARRRNGFQLFLSMTVMTINMQEIQAFLEFAHRLKADAVINPLNPDDGTASLDPFSTRADRDVLARNLQDGLDYARTMRMKTAVNTIKVMQDILRTASLD